MQYDLNQIEIHLKLNQIAFGALQGHRFLQENQNTTTHKMNKNKKIYIMCHTVTLNAKGVLTEHARTHRHTKKNMQSGSISGCQWGYTEYKMNKHRAQTSATEVTHLVLL